MHGKTSPIHHAGDPLFSGLENPFEATRYHSLLLQSDTVADPLEVIAWTAEGEVMAIRHRDTSAWGVQFHPESILTGSGKWLLANFLRLCPAPSERTAS
jgi:anthranilate synthase/aminodeoxychorismate synthase-like glutamine amidotransferase